MPRITLQQQWDAMKAELRAREEAFALETLGTIPEVIFHVTGKGGVERREVYSVANTTLRLYYYGKKTTRDDVIRLKSYLGHPVCFQREKILFYWKAAEELGGSRCEVSGAIYLPDIERSTWDFFDEAKAQAKADEVKAKIQQDQERLDTGWVKCQYCGEVRDPKDIEHKSIISRMYRNLDRKSVV